MISLLLSIIGGVGVPAIITGVLGKLGVGWITKLTGMSGILGQIFQPLVALCIGLVDVLLEVVRWLVRKLMAGLDHITQSVPATFTVLLLMWGAYGYGNGFGFWSWLERPAKVVTQSAPAAVREAPRRQVAPQTPGDWIREALGVQ